ncbi:MAG: MFS family permease [Gammaproteobacteria bacterium]|jgi:MFS family permease
MTSNKFFYGWTIVGVSIVGLATGWAAIGIFSFGAFIKPLELEFGWQRGEISLALAVINLTGIAMAPILGFLVDKHGARKILLPSALMLGLLTASLFFLSSNIWHFYAIWFFVAVLGCATTPLTYSKVIVKWFDRKRGIALGVSLAGVGLGAALMPPLAQAMIDAYGWRVAYLGLSALIVFLGFPLLVLLMRNTPEEMGLGPDGDVVSEEERSKNILPGFTVRETVDKKPFWLMLVIFLCIGMVVTSIIIHLIPMLIERGIDPVKAAEGQAVLGLSLIFGRVFAGYLMDRFFAPHVSIVFMLGPAIGISILASGVTGPAVYLAIALVGMAIGAEFDVMGYLTSRYSGILSYGQIFGFLFAAFELGAAIGPVAMGYCFDITGEYTLVLWIMAGLALLSCALTAMLGPYPDLPETEQSSA